MFEGLRHAIEAGAARRRARPFMEACMACCALVAIADGEVSLSERGRVDQIVENIDRLKLYDVHEEINIFNAFVDGIVEDPVKGRKKAMEAVREMRSDAGDAVLLVKISLAISMADGEFLESERAMCEAICRELGLDLDDYL